MRAFLIIGPILKSARIIKTQVLLQEVDNG
jgi:hypothetical protein